jgi:hypothetical protein
MKPRKTPKNWDNSGCNENKVSDGDDESTQISRMGRQHRKGIEN